MAGTYTAGEALIKLSEYADKKGWETDFDQIGVILVIHTPNGSIPVEYETMPIKCLTARIKNGAAFYYATKEEPPVEEWFDSVMAAHN